MFRLAHLCTTRSFGGLEINVLRLMEWMNARGHRNTLFARSDAAIAGAARARGLCVEPIAPRRKYFDRRTAANIASVTRQNDINALFVHPAGDINLGAMAKRRTHGHMALVYLQHMEIGVSKRDFLHTWAYRNLDVWIVPLPYLRNNVLHRTRVKENTIRVIPLGIEIDRLDPARQDKATSREALNIPADVFLAGVVGRLDVGKGQEYLIRALGLLKDAMPDLHVLIAGDETKAEGQEYGEHLRRLASEAGIGDRVHIRPFQQDIPPLYAALDVFCLTSLSETYGMVTLEAMAMRLPVIATDSTGTPDIVRHDSNGLLVPPRDPASLADAIVRLRTDPAHAQRLASRARQDVETSFTHETQCNQTEALLQSLLHA